MMYVGTSLGKCLRSILMGEVSEQDVLLIITRTRSIDIEKFLWVVKQYYEEGNYTAQDAQAYDIAVKPWNEIEELATQLYESGKIHQPRNFSRLGSQFIHPGLSRDTWIEVSPKSRNTTPAVVQAYEQYKLLDSLTQ
jgi:hypothetical protein